MPLFDGNDDGKRAKITEPNYSCNRARAQSLDCMYKENSKKKTN